MQSLSSLWGASCCDAHLVTVNTGAIVTKLDGDSRGVTVWSLQTVYTEPVKSVTALAVMCIVWLLLQVQS